jgi:transcriptional regulator with XRE-family HTH domain
VKKRRKPNQPSQVTGAILPGQSPAAPLDLKTLRADPAEIAAAVAAVRRGKGWSLRDVAERAAVSPTTVQSLERGDLRLRLDNFLKVLDVLCLRPGDLITAPVAVQKPAPPTFEQEMESRVHRNIVAVLESVVQAAKKPKRVRKRVSRRSD